MKRIQLLIILTSFTLFISSQTNKRYLTQDVNFRTEPSSSSKVIEIIPKGTAVTIQKQGKNSWSYIKYHDENGYLLTKYLSKANPIKTTENNHGPIRYYENSDGDRVQSPTEYESIPKNAVAQCKDGSYSFSKHRKGTCSKHGGVSKWLK